MFLLGSDDIVTFARVPGCVFHAKSITGSTVRPKLDRHGVEWPIAMKRIT